MMGGQLGGYMTAESSQRSTGEIVKDIVGHAQEIIRSEVRLAKTELREEARKAAGAGMMFAATVVFGLHAVGFLLWSATYALAMVMPFWGAALLTGAVLTIVAFTTLAIGRARWREVHKPDRTIGELKENVQWLKHPTRS